MRNVHGRHLTTLVLRLSRILVVPGTYHSFSAQTDDGKGALFTNAGCRKPTKCTALAPSLQLCAGSSSPVVTQLDALWRTIAFREAQKKMVLEGDRRDYR